MIDSVVYFAQKLFHTFLVIGMPGNYFKRKTKYTQGNIENKNVSYCGTAEVYGIS